MNLNPYLSFKGDCETAFKFYEQTLGGKMEITKYAGSPMSEDVSAEWGDKVMHAHLTIGTQVLMGADSPPDSYQQPQGISVTINLKEVLNQNEFLMRWLKVVTLLCRFNKHSGPLALAWLQIGSGYHG